MASIEGFTEDDIKALAEIQIRTMSNPKTRLGQQKLMRDAGIEQQLPELDAYERHAAAEQRLRDELAARDKKIQEIELRTQREGLIQSLIDKGVMDSRTQFEEIERFGVENKIADYEKAAHFWKLSQKSAEPSSTPFAPYSAPTKPVLEGLDKFKGSRSQWAESEAHKAWNEIKSGKALLPMQ